MAVLNKEKIISRLYNSEVIDSHKLIITPILDEKHQIGSCGIDLRLSNHFIVFKTEDMSHFDLGKPDQSKIRKLQRHVVVPFKKSFILQPNTLVLASTFEYISLPTDLWGLLEGRSSWARLGLIIATACSIDPGYKGCITLELTNLGKLPIHLYPGFRICQLILNTMEEPVVSADRTTKYDFQIGPEFSKISEDPEIKFFTS